MALRSLLIVLSIPLAVAPLFNPAHASDDLRQTPAGQVSYYQQIRPIFQAQCQGCHQPAKPKGKYVMTDFAKLLAGGESGEPAIVPGKPEESPLVEMITPEGGEVKMPQGKKPLADAQIELIRRWIAQGAVDDTPESAKVRFDAEHPPVYTLPPVIAAMDFSPDGKLLAIGGFHEVLLHNADGSSLLARLVGMSARIESVRFSPDGKLLAVTGGLPARMGEVQVWDVESRKLKLSVPVSYDTVYGASWSPDGKLIAFGCPDNTVRTIEVETGKQVLQQGAHDDWPLDTVFSLNGSHLISVGRDRTAKLTEVATQRFVDNITSITPGALKGGIESVVRHPTQDHILVGGADGVPKLFRIFREGVRRIGDDANIVRKFPALRGRVFSVAMTRDGSRIAAASSLDGSGQVRVYSYEMEDKLPADVAAILGKVSTTRTPDEEKKLAEYQTRGVQQIAGANFTDGGLYALAFHPDGKLLAAAGLTGKVRLLDAQSGLVVKEFVPVPVNSMAGVGQVSNLPSPHTTAPSPNRQVGNLPHDSAAAAESLLPNDKLTAIEVQPAQATIDHKYDTVQFLVTGRLESGSVVDVSRMAEVQASGDSIELSPAGLARARANGRTELTFSLAGKSAKAAVEVAGADAPFHPDFVRDVTPVLSKMGCNAGTCHGANKGKGGLKLSLRGNDPLFDVRAYADELGCRRVNFASPHDSLMLLKACAGVPHEGGQLTRPGDPYYEIVRQWIADGAKLNGTAPRVAKIEIFPQNPIVERISSKQQFRVIATYADGKTRDVTAETFLTSGNSEVADADSAGLVTTLRRGEAPMLARFEGAYAATTLTVMGDRTSFVWSNPPAYNFIDELVYAKLQRTKTLPSEPCSDAEFIRRVYLDLTGLPPTADDVRRFLADVGQVSNLPNSSGSGQVGNLPHNKAKRDELIDRLIGSPEYVEHRTNKWADLLQVNRKYLGVEGAKLFREWIQQEIARNTPYDLFVSKILTASGSTRENPPASFFKIHRTPEDTMETTTHLFLGVRFNCNHCHDHPFERWTQNEYYSTAAFFARTGLKRDPASGKQVVGQALGATELVAGQPLYEIVFDKNDGDVIHERTGEPALAKLPYETQHEAPDNPTPREQIARWITSKDNRYFAKSFVNRVWTYLMGAGFIEPLDDIRAGNPPTNAELLDRLTQEFINSGFNVRQLVRTIAKSRTYQLSVETNQWNEDDRINYSHALPKRLPAEVLFDALHRVTGSAAKLTDLPTGARAAQLLDPEANDPGGFLAKFGRPPRESPCECERSSGLDFGPIMAMVSGPTVAGAISDPNNEITKLVAAQPDDAKLVEEMFLRILNRPATPAEIEASVKLIRDMPDEHQKLTGELAEYEKSLAPKIAEQEQARLATIEKAKAELAAYETEIAPREAALDKERHDRTTKLEADLTAYDKTLPDKLAAWLARENKETEWVPLDPAELSSTSPSRLVKEKDLSVFATDQNGSGQYKFVAYTDLVGITGVRLEVLTDPRLPKQGPGRAPDGNFMLTEFSLTAAPKADPAKATKITLELPQADFSQQGFDISSAIDGIVQPDGNGWAIAGGVGKAHRASFVTSQPVGFDGDTTLTFVLDQQFQTGEHTIGRFRISVTRSTGPILLDGVSPHIAAILAVPQDARSDADRAELASYFRAIDGELKKLQQAVADSKKPRPVDPKLQQLRDRLAEVSRPLPVDPKLAQLRNDVELSTKQITNPRLVAAQDIAWALVNSPAFMFNR